MAQITIRDLATNEDIVIPPEGYIFGRVGGDADIQLEDNTISRRQGRVSLKGGMWLFETLAVPQGTRPPRPVQLQDGSTFAIGGAEFEVVQVELDQEEEEFDAGAQTIAPGKGNVKPAAPAARKAPPAPSNAKTAAAAPAPKKATAQAAGRAVSAAAANAPDDNEPFRFDPKALLAGAAKGVAYYLVNVPKLLVNPIGTVKKTIEEQPAEPLGQMGLVGYALPASLATALLSSWAGFLAALIGPGHSFQIMLLFPIVQLIVAVVVAIVTGFVFHPVLKWIINFLKGESDARSRSNYFLQLQTVNIVLAVPSALGVILSSLPIPFIGLLGGLLGVVASVAAIYVHYQWFVHFKVVDWFKKVLLVLGAVSVIFALIGFVTGVIATIRGLGSGGGTPSAEVADVGDAPETDLGEMPTDPEELKAWTAKRQAALMAKAQADQKKAMDAVKAAQDNANAAVKDAEDDAKEDTKAPPPEKVEKTEKTEKPNVVASPEPTREPVKDTPPAVKEEPVKANPVAANSAYGTFARRRDAVEKTFEADPTILQKNTELQILYAEYLDEAYELDKKYGKETSKKPERRLLNQRLRDAELYQKTSKTVDSLAGKLGIK
ncbi:MAG: hypothetical protein ACO1OB_20220 [Archangium sp.]